MTNRHSDIVGSAARHHERLGGNIRPKTLRLPFGGDAARSAEQDGSAVNRNHGVHAVRPKEYHSTLSIPVTPRSGSSRASQGLVAPDLTTRVASDYLPEELKSQLIAQGKISAEGVLLPGSSNQGTADLIPMPDAISRPISTRAAILRSLRELIRKVLPIDLTS